MLKLDFDRKEIVEVIDRIVHKTMNMDPDLGLALRCGLLWNRKGVGGYEE